MNSLDKEHKSKDTEAHSEKQNNVNAELENAKKIAEEYKDSLQRLQAEFENFSKRTEREKQEYKKYLNASLLEEFFPLMDTVSEGIKHAEKANNKEMKHGFESLEKQLGKIFEKNGVRKIETRGKKFDSNLHDCLMTTNEKEKKDGDVLEEFQKGYTLHDKVLRPAKVKVNKRE